MKCFSLAQNIPSSTSRPPLLREEDDEGAVAGNLSKHTQQLHDFTTGDTSGLSESNSEPMLSMTVDVISFVFSTPNGFFETLLQSWGKYFCGFKA